MNTQDFRFRRHANLGAAAAEDDADFLSDSFVDTGDLSTLMDCTDRRRIVVGRTGSGKTALLQELGKHPRAIPVQPESLSLAHIANSNVLQFFHEAGVKLDLFFRLLWRHVFTVELIKARYGITNEATKRNALQRLLERIGSSRAERRALDYLENWGSRFWETTEHRIRELVTRVESDLKGSLKLGSTDAQLGAGAARKLTEEQKGGNSPSRPDSN